MSKARSADLSDIEIVGESAWQENLARVAGGRTREGVDLPVRAEFAPEAGDRPSADAVAVFVDGLQVGLLLGESAKAYRAALGAQNSSCAARIIGGWERGEFDSGYFGIRVVDE